MHHRILNLRKHIESLHGVEGMPDAVAVHESASDHVRVRRTECPGNFGEHGD